ncbi:hypothetical protein JYK14_07935 [Siccirubricoccus sp. KC 17139]|uniref:Uncharacterized protein n=1 Tax=Siccirubricoccus soli TaxID=2899147 RepID=A0ABT1D2G3_9PROT|nr:hypothetical protein [Siccirubricoccus soli]MCO6416098.1 hypothetical protein [Siccirubricoccus soli]MCP2682230.1 hypothetical protein [Siccirubricoccus soli]
MARLVYACRFDAPSEDAWEKVVRPRYERWVSDRYRRAFETTINLDLSASEVAGRLPSGHSLNIRRYVADGTALELEWAFPGENGLVWRNLVRMAQLTDRCAVEHRVEVASAEYLLAPAFYSVGAPAVVRTICQQEMLIGDMRVRAAVYPLPEEGIHQFVGLLEAEQRRLPVVLVTPFANGEPGDLDPQSLADRLAGVAIVAQADTPETTRLLSDRLARLGCYDGGVRVYWPGFRSSDDLRRHPLMLGSRIAILGPERAARTLERWIFSVAAFRFVPDPRIAAIIGASEAASRAERAQEAVEQGGTTWEQYAHEMSEKLDGALAELDTLRIENANLRANQNALFSFSEDADGQDEDEQAPREREPTSVREAVDFAAEDCPCLLFLDTSRSSADDSPFRRPQEIYEVLSMMNKVSGVWARNRGGGDLRQMLRDEGLGKRVSNFISQTSKGKWGDDYTFIYNGTSQIFEWHVTLGAGAADTCASIHFLPDQDCGKLVIAHVGRHLTNTRS